ncbi:hypothetical protein KXD40_002843 [Peronospora effusa]|uniref:Uncharacterized protein n=1 Tax=Peronospora effusa TaxID=542832 RepID=A0A3M6V7Y8_9STRA|nr:hypothetical protein DD238_007628 [Peronospora effusa]RQM11862.1 hypothetical protein DD237_007876 [Peronospora effusa]UIZ29860.1 hypothetical protein KXD40_002843 [Peronospora effusa]
MDSVDKELDEEDNWSVMDVVLAAEVEEIESSMMIDAFNAATEQMSTIERRPALIVTREDIMDLKSSFLEIFEWIKSIEKFYLPNS